MTDPHNHVSAGTEGVSWQARPPHSDWRLIAPEHLDDYRAKDWEVRPMPTDAQSVGMREALEEIQKIGGPMVARIARDALAAQPPAATVETKRETEDRLLQKATIASGEVLYDLPRSSAASESPFKEIEPPFSVYHQLTEIGDKNGHVCTAENGEIAKDILAALNIAALQRLSADNAESLRKQLEDTQAELEAWFGFAERAETEAAPALINGLKGYLQTCQSGGMPKEQADLAMAVLEDYCRLYAGEALAPVLRAIAKNVEIQEAPSLNREGREHPSYDNPLDPFASPDRLPEQSAVTEGVAALGIQEVADAWGILESHGFPPEAVNWPEENIAGKLPVAIDNALTAIVGARDDLLAEVIRLRAEPQSASVPVEAIRAAVTLLARKITKLSWSRDDCRRKGQDVYVANLTAQIDKLDGYYSALSALVLSRPVRGSDNG